jgi:hypothetical protein
LSFTKKCDAVRIKKQLLSLQNFWMDNKFVEAAGQCKISLSLKEELREVEERSVDEPVFAMTRPAPFPTATESCPWKGS